MNIEFWEIDGSLIAEFDGPDVPRAGEAIDIDNEGFVVDHVKWVVVAEEMSAEIYVRKRNGHAHAPEESAS